MKNRVNKLVCIGGFGYNFSKYIKNQNLENIDFIVYKNKKGFFDRLCRREITDNIEEIKTFIGKDTQRLFVLAGLGGNTGTDIASAITELSKSLGITTMGIVTIPFNYEGAERRSKAILEIERLKETSDILIVVDNEKLSNQYRDLDFSETFEKANTTVWNIITKISNEATNISEIIEDNNEVFLEIVK